MTRYQTAQLLAGVSAVGFVLAAGLHTSEYRGVVLREVVREVARRHELRATFVPLLDPTGPGNGVHIHLALCDARGRPALYDAGAPAHMSDVR